MITIAIVLAAVAAAAAVLTSRLRGRPLTPRTLYALPAVLCAVGLLQLTGAAGRQLRAVDVALIAVGAAVSGALGLARGATVAVFERDGVSWLRYRPATLLLWAFLSSVAIFFGAAAAAQLEAVRAGARPPQDTEKVAESEPDARATGAGVAVSVR